MGNVREKIMIKRCCIFINDDPWEQHIFAEALGDIFPDILCFTSPTAVHALYFMTKQNLVPDYIFMEFNLPKMDGIEFLNVIKKNDVLREIPVIVHSVSVSPNQISALKDSGALAIYPKPYDYFGVCTMLSLCFGSNLLRISQN